jgi:hypothetical protein
MGVLNFKDQPKLGEMLEFSKKVLTNVSFDRMLFRKELKKAMKWLTREELGQLKQWCQNSFGHVHGDIIAESFPAASC